MTHSQSDSHGDEVFVFMERVTPVEGRFEDCLSITLDSAKLLYGQPGLLQSMVMRPQKKDGPICSISVWKSKGDFQAFMKTEVVAALLKSEAFANMKEWMDDYDGQMMDLADGWHP